MTEQAKAHRGFAAMDRAAHRELARSGGQAAHRSGLAHKFDSNEAREAGRKGGAITASDRAHMAEIGRKGGFAKRGYRRANQEDHFAQMTEENAKSSVEGDSSGNSRTSEGVSMSSQASLLADKQQFDRLRLKPVDRLEDDAIAMPQAQME